MGKTLQTILLIIGGLFLIGVAWALVKKLLFLVVVVVLVGAGLSYAVPRLKGRK